MDWIGLVSMVLNVLLGGGLIAQFVTLKSIKKQAEATAKGAEAVADSQEIDNVDKVAKMWREYAETSELRYQTTLEKMSTEMGSMRKRMGEMDCTIKKLSTQNNQILNILKDINHDNLEQKKQEAEGITRN